MKFLVNLPSPDQELLAKVPKAFTLRNAAAHGVGSAPTVDEVRSALAVLDHVVSLFDAPENEDVLKQAIAREDTTLIITTHDDDTNVALTIFFRRLRSNWQILTRSTLDRNVPTLLRAGADLVLSYAAMGSNTILNVLRGSDHLLLAEGVNVFPSEIPAAMAGRKLADLHVRSQTGCSIIAVEEGGKRLVNPGADFVLPQTGRMFLIGNIEAEDQFLKKFRPVLRPNKKSRRAKTRR
jgi:Trk K+ transport system NAD-binding subunit